jgi:hypothetical protein
MLRSAPLLAWVSLLWGREGWQAGESLGSASVWISESSFGSTVLIQFKKDCIELVCTIPKTHAENIHQAILTDTLMLEFAIQEEVKGATLSLYYFEDSPLP